MLLVKTEHAEVRAPSVTFCGWVGAWALRKEDQQQENCWTTLSWGGGLARRTPARCCRYTVPAPRTQAICKARPAVKPASLACLPIPMAPITSTRAITVKVTGTSCHTHDLLCPHKGHHWPAVPLCTLSGRLNERHLRACLLPCPADTAYVATPMALS